MGQFKTLTDHYCLNFRIDRYFYCKDHDISNPDILKNVRKSDWQLYYNDYNNHYINKFVRIHKLYNYELIKVFNDSWSLVKFENGLYAIISSHCVTRCSIDMAFKLPDELFSLN